MKGRNDLSGALNAGRRRAAPYANSALHRPREDIILPKQNWWRCWASGLGGLCYGAVAPPEVSSIDPHAMKNDGETTRQRNDGASGTAALSHAHAP